MSKILPKEVCNAKKKKIWKIVPAAIRIVREKECAANASIIITGKGKFQPAFFRRILKRKPPAIGQWKIL